MRANPTMAYQLPHQCAEMRFWSKAWALGPINAVTTSTITQYTLTALQPCAVCIVAPPYAINYLKPLISPSRRGRTIYQMARAKHHSKHRCKKDSIEKFQNASARAACGERFEDVLLLKCSMILVLRDRAVYGAASRNWK
jgi:hypothetical protein